MALAVAACVWGPWNVSLVWLSLLFGYGVKSFLRPDTGTVFKFLPLVLWLTYFVCKVAYEWGVREMLLYFLLVPGAHVAQLSAVC